MSVIDVCLDMLISAIKNGEIYLQYSNALQKLNEKPALKEQVDELRKMNYRIQAEGEDATLYDDIDEVDAKMDELCRIAEVNQFLEAELALCRQLQSINASIHQGIDLDIPNLV